MIERFEMFTLFMAKCNRAIKKIKSEEMKDLNLKSPHVSCLYYLFKSKNSITASQLCDLCEEDKAYISRSIDYLEKNGYIERITKTEKPYKTPLLLTKKGKEIASVIVKKIDEIVDMASEGLTEENRIIFYKSLALIIKNLQKICDNYGETNEYKNIN